MNRVTFHLKVLSALGAFLLPVAAPADTIVLSADEWCPYNCVPGSNRPGFMVEIAQEALEPYGHTIDYQTLNWARSLHRAELGEINGVIGAIPEEAPTFVFGPPLGIYGNVVAFRRGEAVDLGSLGSGSALRIGAINGYEYDGAVNDYIKANADDRSIVQYMAGDDALQKNIKKLVAGRLDMVAEVRSVLEYTLQQLDMADQVEIVGPKEQGEIFIAFSPALSSSRVYAEQLATGVERLRASGRLDEILEAYGQPPSVP